MVVRGFSLGILDVVALPYREVGEIITLCERIEKSWWRQGSCFLQGGGAGA